MVNLRGGSGGTGWDFSAGAALPVASLSVDMLYSDTLGFAEIYAADGSTDIQDAGYASTLDAVDFAPSSGWSPTGSVEAIAGHCYVVWTRDNHFAKFRVTSVSVGQVVIRLGVPDRRLATANCAPGAPVTALPDARQAFVTQR